MKSDYELLQETFDRLGVKYTEEKGDGSFRGIKVESEDCDDWLEFIFCEQTFEEVI